jgi:hypothetical protein
VVTSAVETYGRLTEGIHISGYSFERACRHLEWLLIDDRWKACGEFKDVNGFLDSLRLDQFRPVAETRKRIAERIKALQPDASNRQIATTLGVNERTIRRDTAANAAPSDHEPKQSNGLGTASAANAAPSSLTGDEQREANRREVMLRIIQQAWAALRAFGSDEFIASLSDRLVDPKFRERCREQVSRDELRDNQLGEQLQSAVRNLIDILDFLREEDGEPASNPAPQKT